jgi:signal transduction histidine kinase
MAEPDSDVTRLLWQVEQRNRALECEVQRSQALERERARLLEAEQQASARAQAADTHLARLQRVASALSEALTVSDVQRILQNDVAEAAEAKRTYLAVLGDTGLSLIEAEPAPSRRNAPASEPNPVPESVGELLERAHELGVALWPEPTSELVTLPLVVASRRLGAVLFQLQRAHALTAPERALLEDLTRQLAVALDRVRMCELAKLECARAEEANLAKDEFLAMLGHELRNPLSPMLTAITLMRARLGDAALKERLIIERQLNHMARLVDDLLDVSRIRRGSLKLSRRYVELAEVVQRAVEMASPMLDERSHRLTLQVPLQGAQVHVDTHRLAQAIAKLLMNAAKYTPPGGSVVVSASVEVDRVVLQVRDDGIGIESALLSRVFEPFVQRRQALDRSDGGLGLGLAIARRVVELHGGIISAASEGMGAGSTFSIELGLAEAGTSHALPPPSSSLEPRSSRAGALLANAPSLTSVPPRVVRVMVVDDNVDAAEMLADALRAGGHEVAIAHDGPSALSLAESFQPELALLDIGLPVMNGFDLAERLKARLSNAPPLFVAVTGYGRPADRARTKQVGFAEHLVKPIDLVRLDAIVRSLACRT